MMPQLRCLLEEAGALFVATLLGYFCDQPLLGINYKDVTLTTTLDICLILSFGVVDVVIFIFLSTIDRMSRVLAYANHHILASYHLSDCMHASVLVD